VVSVKKSLEMSCTPEELVNILTFPSGGLMMLPGNPLDEVFPNLFIGEE